MWQYLGIKRGQVFSSSQLGTFSHLIPALGPDLTLNFGFSSLFIAAITTHPIAVLLISSDAT
jgi:hypothetical protein